jgi:chemotaxis protein MotA
MDFGAAIAPAFGMLGTFVGLIAMLKNLDDPSALGPGMSLCIITSFYGSIIANMICIPISKKLKLLTSMECRQKELILEGIISISEGSPSHIIREKLESYISRSARQRYNETKGTSVRPEVER